VEEADQHDADAVRHRQDGEPPPRGWSSRGRAPDRQVPGGQRGHDEQHAVQHEGGVHEQMER
jgi:hypothetical protein